MRKKESAFSSRLRSAGLFGSLTAVAAAVGGPPLTTANADIIYSGTRNLTSSGTVRFDQNTSDQLSVDLDGVGDAEFVINISVSTFARPGRWVPAPNKLAVGHWESAGHSITVQYTLGSQDPEFPVHFIVASADKGIHQLTAQEKNAVIGPDRVFSPQGVSIPPWMRPDGTDVWFGFRFNPSGTRPLYGWARMNFITPPTVVMHNGSQPVNRSLKLIDWAYDDTGAPIRAGQMPPPVIQSIQAANGGVTITWSGGGILQTAENPAGPFTDLLNAVSPYSEPVGTRPRCFFRIRQVE